MQLPELLRTLDTDLLLAVNGARHPLLDTICYWSSYKFTWIPFYALLLFVVYRQMKRKALFVVPAIAFMITCTDQVSTLLKNTTCRLRPCHEPDIRELVQLVDNICGGQYGFVSSHAANTMALAVFLWLTLPRKNNYLRGALVIFVALNAYSRMYMAAHYPLDILGGWLLGFIFALLLSSIVGWVTVKNEDAV